MREVKPEGLAALIGDGLVIITQAGPDVLAPAPPPEQPLPTDADRARAIEVLRSRYNLGTPR